MASGSISVERRLGGHHIKCRGCGADWEYKFVYTFPPKRKIECAVCGMKTKGERRAVVTVEELGLGLVVCRECKYWCPECWDQSVYDYLILQYG